MEVLANFVCKRLSIQFNRLVFKLSAAGKAPKISVKQETRQVIFRDGAPISSVVRLRGTPLEKPVAGVPLGTGNEQALTAE